MVYFTNFKLLNNHKIIIFKQNIKLKSLSIKVTKYKKYQLATQKQLVKNCNDQLEKLSDSSKLCNKFKVKMK